MIDCCTTKATTLEESQLHLKQWQDSKHFTILWPLFFSVCVFQILSQIITILQIYLITLQHVQRGSFTVNTQLWNKMNFTFWGIIEEALLCVHMLLEIRKCCLQLFCDHWLLVATVAGQHLLHITEQAGEKYCTLGILEIKLVNPYVTFSLCFLYSFPGESLA